MQGDELTTSLQWERGRGDGVDYENNTLLNIDTMNTGVTQDTVVYRQQTSVVSCFSHCLSLYLDYYQCYIGQYS